MDIALNIGRTDNLFGLENGLVGSVIYDGLLRM